MLIMARRHIVVREDTYKKLHNIKAAMQVKSIDSVINMLIERYYMSTEVQSIGKMIIDSLKMFLEQEKAENKKEEKEGGVE
mgnify:CR=1 FL=1